MLFHRLALNAPGLWDTDVKHFLNGFWAPFPAVGFHFAENGLDPFQSGHSVVFYQALTAEPPDLVDNVGLSFQEYLY